MKKIISIVIELLLIILLFFWLWRKAYAITAHSGKIPAFIIAFAFGIVMSKIIELIVDNIALKNIVDQEHNLLLNRWVVCLFPISLVFYLVFKVSMIFYNEYETEQLIIVLSIGYSAIHLIISSTLDDAVNSNWSYLMIDIKDAFKYEEIDEDEYL